jgi:predicted MFS family arabinose efflux permease
VKRASALLTELFASSPLRHRPFRAFYVGAIGAALGYTIQSTIAAWHMTTLTSSAWMVALVQTASSAPTLLFGLFAGSLADIVDRKRVILVTQVVMLAAATILGLGTLAGAIGPVGLLALTFAIGAGFTFYLPAQQATTNDLVARSELPRAVALGAVAFNVARAAGPALAGAVAALIGSGSAFLMSALCFAVMITTLRGWRSPPARMPGIPETVLSGIQSGLRFMRHSGPLRALLVRNFSFCICGSALMALLPVVARDQLGLGAAGFGVLFGSFGAGAVLGALTIPRHLAKMSLTRLVKLGGLLWVAATLLVAIADTTAFALYGCFAAGAAWVSVLASLAAGMQSSMPAWVRARAMSLGLLATQGSLAVGGVLWGGLASFAGTRLVIALAATALFVLHVVNRGVRVTMGEEADVTPRVQLPDLAIATEPMPTDGPVLVQIEYRIEPESRAAFLKVMDAIGPTRRRNGANSWRVFRDVGEDGRFVERYIITSWAEYMRLRMRMTEADRRIQDRVEELQKPGVPIRVSRLIGVETHD